MSVRSQVSKWVKRLLILAGLAALLFNLALFLDTSNILTIDLGLTISTMTLLVVLILMRQIEISREFRDIKNQSAALVHYEQDMQDRLETLTQKVDSVEASPHIQTAHAEAIEEINRRLDALQRNIENKADINFSGEDDEDFHPIDQLPKTKIERVDDDPLRRRPGRPHKLNEKSLNLHLQPIVELPSRRPAYFDAFMRLSSGNDGFVDQKEFRQIVETAGLTATIDKKVIFSAVRMVRKLNLLKKRAGIFCPLSPKSLLNLGAFREITGFLQANSSLSQSLIVEINARDFAGLNQEQLDRLSEFPDLDIGLCLSDVQDLKLDPQYLARYGFRFVKVHSSILIHANIDTTHKDIQPANLASVLGVEGIQLIGTGVERDRDAIHLIDMDLPLAQGLFFAPPRPVKAELLINAEPADKVELKSSA